MGDCYDPIYVGAASPNTTAQPDCILATTCGLQNGAIALSRLVPEEQYECAQHENRRVGHGIAALYILSSAGWLSAVGHHLYLSIYSFATK
jgi:hypothetical protein